MLKQSWQKIRSLFTNTSPKQEPEVDITRLPILDRCRLMYTTLDLTPYQQYTMQDGHGKAIATVHPNIESCITDIAIQTAYLEQVQYIPHERVNTYEHTNRPINRFFITKEGCYLSSVYTTLDQLKLGALGLFDAIDATKDTDYYSYNLRVLNALLFALYDLGNALNEIADSIKLHS